MNPIQLGIKFVRGYEPTPVPDPVPGSGTGATSGLTQTGGLAQTGDIKIAIIAGLILLALTIVGMVVIKNQKGVYIVMSIEEMSLLVDLLM